MVSALRSWFTRSTTHPQVPAAPVTPVSRDSFGIAKKQSKAPDKTASRIWTFKKPQAPPAPKPAVRQEISAELLSPVSITMDRVAPPPQRVVHLFDFDDTLFASHYFAKQFPEYESQLKKLIDFSANFAFERDLFRNMPTAAQERRLAKRQEELLRFEERFSTQKAQWRDAMLADADFCAADAQAAALLQTLRKGDEDIIIISNGNQQWLNLALEMSPHLRAAIELVRAPPAVESQTYKQVDAHALALQRYWHDKQNGLRMESGKIPMFSAREWREAFHVRHDSKSTFMAALSKMFGKNVRFTNTGDGDDEQRVGDASGHRVIPLVKWPTPAMLRDQLKSLHARAVAGTYAQQA